MEDFEKLRSVEDAGEEIGVGGFHDRDCMFGETATGASGKRLTSVKPTSGVTSVKMNGLGGAP